MIIKGILNNIKERRQDVSHVVNIPDELSLVSGDQFHVMDRHNVSLLMSPDPDHVCHHDPVVIVTSAPANSKLRDEVREQFRGKAPVIFLLGATTEKLQHGLREEHLKFNDIIQIDVVDSYTNLPYKTIYSFIWINR